MDNKLKHTLHVSAALLIAFFVSKVVGDIFFISDSPILRSDPAMYIAQKIDKSTGPLLAFLKIRKSGSYENPDVNKFASLDDFKQAMSSAVNIPMKQVATGTYASTVQGKDVQIIKLNEIPYREYTYTIDGKQIKIRVPETMSPPTEDEVKSVEKL